MRISSTVIKITSLTKYQSRLITLYLFLLPLIIAPWCFGLVHSSIILAFTIYLGVLAISYIASSVNFQTPNHFIRLIGRIGYKEKLLIFVICAFLVYLLISIVNYRADYSNVTQYFSYNSNYVPYLPTTYNFNKSLNIFFIILVNTSFLIAFLIFILSFPTKPTTGCLLTRLDIFKKILFALVINSTLVSVFCILYRLEPVFNFLHFYFPFEVIDRLKNYGPYAYRSNAATYINMGLVCNLGLIFNLNLFSIGQTKSPKFLFNLTLLIQLFASVNSISRSGILVCLCAITIYLVKQCSKSTKDYMFRFSILAVSIIAIALCYKQIGTRFEYRSFQYPVNAEKNLKNFSLHYEIITGKKIDPQWVSLFSISENKNFHNGKSVRLHFDKDELLHLGFYYDNNLIQKIEIPFYSKNHRRISSINLMYSRGSSTIIATYEDTKIDRINFQTVWELFKPAFIINYSDFRESKLNIIESSKMEIVSQDDPNYYFSNFSTTGTLLKCALRMAPDRTIILLNCLSYYKDHIKFGTGIGSWSVIYLLNKKPGDKWEAWAHCDVLQLLMTLGLVGFLMIVFMFVLLWFNNENSLTQPIFNNFDYKVLLATFSLNSLLDFPVYVYSLIFTFVYLVVAFYAVNYDDRLA